jgi:hypothetical protein
VPRVVEQDGITIYVYSADHNPPHVHAFDAEHEALIEIETGVVLVGHLPGPRLADARGLVASNRAALQARWDQLNPAR